MDDDQVNGKEDQSHTNEDGEKNVKHYLQRQEDKRMGTKEDKGQGRPTDYQGKKVAMGRTHCQNDRRKMDPKTDNMETMEWKEK